MSGLSPVMVLPMSQQGLGSECVERGSREGHFREVCGGLGNEWMLEFIWTTVILRDERLQ